jgi:hypothetical protein
MGDRALVVFHNGEEGKNLELSPVAYLHWSGSDMGSLLGELRERMRGRDKDVGYTFSRFLGIAHGRLDGNLSLGAWNGPRSMGEALRIESHGDAGMFLVDLSGPDWCVLTWGGYGFNGPAPAGCFLDKRSVGGWDTRAGIEGAPEAPASDDELRDMLRRCQNSLRFAAKGELDLHWKDCAGLVDLIESVLTKGGAA